MAKTTVIIPNWNGKKYLGDCLFSVVNQEGCTPDIIVVDNGSEDGSVSFVKENYPTVRLIEFQENTGFCKAVNAGIQAAETEFVLLLNNDTKADKHFVRQMEQGIGRSEQIFSVSGKLLSMKDPEYVDDAGDYYCALGWAYAQGKGKKDCAAYSHSKKIFASCGGAAIYRRKIFEEIGFFDEEHFAYLEDIDIGYRAKIYGYINVFEPTAIVYHAGSAASGSKYNEFKVNFSSRNSVYIVRKNMPLLQIVMNLPFLAAGFLIKTLFFVKKGLGKTYVKGLIEGIKLGSSKKGRGKRVKFKGKHIKNYIGIQWELWVNIFRRFSSGR